MRKTSLVAAVAVVSLFILIQIACQPATDRSDSIAPNTNSGREPVDTAAIEGELLRIENDWPRVIRERDVAAVGRVEADDVLIVYPDGSVGNKERDLKDIGEGNLTADAIEITDLKVTVLDNDAAYVTGHTELKNAKYMLPDGKAMDMSGKFRFLDTFARRNGDWKLVAGMSTKVTAPVVSSSPAPATSPATRPATSPTTPPARRPAPTATPAVRVSPATSPAATRPTP